VGLKAKESEEAMKAKTAEKEKKAKEAEKAKKAKQAAVDAENLIRIYASLAAPHREYGLRFNPLFM